jgi:hypothetical protein
MDTEIEIEVDVPTVLVLSRHETNTLIIALGTEYDRCRNNDWPTLATQCAELQQKLAISIGRM